MNESLYGIFGGTFDPIHCGHLETVANVLQQCGLKKILFVPAFIPPHKSETHANPQQRLEMVRLAVADIAEFDVDDREIKRNTVSYTFDTVQSLQSEYPRRKFCFIVGVDALLGIEQWHRWRELIGIIHFIVMERPGWQPPARLPQWWQQGAAHSIEELLHSRSGRFLVVKVDPNPLSATEIRYGISQALDVGAMLPAKVWDYICTHHLYSTAKVEKVISE